MIKVENDVLQTTVYFSGINYSNPLHTIYQYKITEQHNDWIDLGENQFFSFPSQSPGIYHLVVRAANEDGVWSDPKEIVLVFLPKWYQTWWFYCSIVLGCAGILYGLYSYRVSQIKKQHEIRRSIATDLHDDLGSTLNSVKVFTHLAINNVQQQESLLQVKQNLEQATSGLRDMIWVLDDSLDTIDELVARLKQFALPISNACNIDVTIHAESKINNQKLSKDEKRNLFLICKEAINNSIKYSGGDQISVSFTSQQKLIRIIVQDNGKGFDVAGVKAGYGLKNMKYRAKQINYTVILSSESNNGTTVIIQPT